MRNSDNNKHDYHRAVWADSVDPFYRSTEAKQPQQNVIPRANQTEEEKAFFLAVVNGDIPLLQKYLAQDSELIYKKNVLNGDTVFHMVAEKRNSGFLVNNLRPEQLKVFNNLSSEDHRAFCLDAEKRNVEVFEFLLKNIKPELLEEFINMPNEAFRTPLYLAAGKKDNEELCKLLLNNGAQVDKEGAISPFYIIADRQDENLCKILIDHAKSVNNNFSTANYSHCGLRTYSPLHIAAAKGSKKICEMLLDNGAVVDDLSVEEETPLHYASYYKGNIEIIDLLLERGATIDKKNYRGETPLHCATHYGNIDNCKHLLAKGADPLSEDNSHMTVMDKAKSAAREGKFKPEIKESEQRWGDWHWRAAPPQDEVERVEREFLGFLKNEMETAKKRKSDQNTPPTSVFKITNTSQPGVNNNSVRTVS